MYKLQIEAESLSELAVMAKAHSDELAKAVGTYQTTENNVSASQSYPLPPVPTVPAAPTAGNLSGDVDSEGLPWDARIHSSSKKKNADGRWAKRKGTDDATYHQVSAELRAGGNAGTTFAPVSGVQHAPVAPIPPAPMIPAAPQYNPPAQPNFVPPAPPAPVYTPPPIPVQQPQPQVASSQNISDLFNKIQQMFQSGSADANYINSLTSRLSQRFSVQVASINDIAGRPDMIADAFALIAADGK